MNTPFSNTLLELFNEAAKFEQRAADVYGELARRFPNHSDIAQFWINMQADELIHMQLLHDISGHVASQQLLSPAPKYVWDKAMSVDQLLDYAEAALIESLQDAYLLASEIEDSELNAIFLFLVMDCVPFECHKTLAGSYLGYHRANLRRFGSLYRPAVREAIGAHADMLLPPES